MEDGRISKRGSFDELKKSNGAFARFLETHLEDEDCDDVAKKPDYKMTLLPKPEALRTHKRSPKSTTQSDITGVTPSIVDMDTHLNEEDMSRGSVSELFFYCKSKYVCFVSYPWNKCTCTRNLFVRFVDCAFRYPLRC